MTGSIDLVGELTNAQYKEAIQSGMLTFSLNPDGLAQIDYGINTKVTLLADEDEGWKKFAAPARDMSLIDRIVYTLHPYLGKWNNNEDGRAFVVTIANGIIQTMIREGGLESGQLIVDPNYPPQGDSAWFRFSDLADLDSIEKYTWISASNSRRNPRNRKEEQRWHKTHVIFSATAFLMEASTSLMYR